MSLTWLTSAAWWLATLVILPIAVHLLARQRRQPLRFPTVRFVDESAAPARRRWTPREPLLLAVRVTIVLALAAALAGPLLVTPSRQARWDAPLAQALVVDPSAAAVVPTPTEAGEQRRFATVDLRAGVADAAAWLSAHRFARREIVVVAPLTRGTLDLADVQAVPTDIGVRVVRAGAPPVAPTARTRVQLVDGVLWRIRETVTLDATSTTVREIGRTATSNRVVDADAPPAERDAAEAARRAVLRRGVVNARVDEAPITVPWTGDITAFAAAVDASTGDGLGREPTPIPETTLSAMTRPPAPRGPSAPGDDGDRRVAWLVVLLLLGVESWLRRRPA